MGENDIKARRTHIQARGTTRARRGDGACVWAVHWTASADTAHEQADWRNRRCRRQSTLHTTPTHTCPSTYSRQPSTSPMRIDRQVGAEPHGTAAAPRSAIHWSTHTPAPAPPCPQLLFLAAAYLCCPKLYALCPKLCVTPSRSASTKWTLKLEAPIVEHR